MRHAQKGCNLDSLFDEKQKLSRYSGDMKFGHLWIWNRQKEVGLQMVHISNGIENLET